MRGDVGADHGPLSLFRAMDEDEDGLPLVGPYNFTLGVRTDGKPRDIDVDEHGWVHPARPRPQGMSVAPGDASALPIRHRPASLGGQATYPVWCILATDLGPGLKYVATSAMHGVIEPAESMPLTMFERLVAATRGRWRKVYDEKGNSV